jgi:hypothetical protein
MINEKVAYSLHEQQRKPCLRCIPMLRSRRRNAQGLHNRPTDELLNYLKRQV